MAKPPKNNRVRSLVAALTPKQARKEIRAEAKLAYGDKLRDYGKQIGASKQQSRQINQWYDQYRDNVADIQRGQARSTADLQGQARSWDNTAATRSKAEANRVSGEEDRSAAIRGALPNSGANATDSAAEEQRNALRKSYGMRAAEMGTASNNLLGQFREASFSGLRDDQRRERNIRLNLQKDRNATKKEMGAFKVAQGAVKRKEEREWRFQNKSLRSDNRNAAADRALDQQRENRIASEGSGGGGGSKGSGGGGGYKPAEIRSTVSQLREQLREDGISPKSPKSISRQRREILDRLISPPNAIDPALARAAYRKVLNAARRWDSNPNNVGSSAWNNRNQNR